MKKVAIALCVLAGNIIFAPLFCAFADDSLKAATAPVVVHTIFGGVVKSVSWADPVKGTKSEIVVKDASGKTTNILITSTTTLWDADVKAIMPDKLAVKEKVNVIYITTEEGINVGKSIKILKK